MSISLFVMVTDALSPFVVAFDSILNGPFRQFQAASEKIGDDVKTIVSKTPLSLLADSCISIKYAYMYMYMYMC